MDRFRRCGVTFDKKGAARGGLEPQFGNVIVRVGSRVQALHNNDLKIQQHIRV